MNCIATCVTADSYQYYIPTFVYSAKRSMSDVHIKIFIQGKPDPSLLVDGAEIIPMFSDFPPCPSILRYLVPDEFFKNYDYIYFTDIDFVFLPHDKKNLFHYHSIMIDKSKTCYAGHRGPIGAKKYPWKKWDGKRTRIAGGAFMATWDWLKKTRSYRDKTLARVKTKGLTYREEDEVILYNICHKSGLETPEVVGHFINGNKYNIDYRDLHLGDFKFDNRYVNFSKMKQKFITMDNVDKFKELDNIIGWRNTCRLAERDPLVAETIKRARWYVRHCH